ncbi:tRNA uridine-5-carboxymethylaminomethyl(34) synthesis enzyme MnmG [Dethiosulfovibrio salsuginis]|uniref:tRNA uridine 5-carboxymethylaminomethyl modification enzyme MnmG n=1 Tax=Dethiosulfovibrio salsuginis TaxID=561720 RepID=A0A1X7JF32_9BACT|nr:tRNA uridine-5-carboxymethylaminomethyl(34) synthesis enzyme MnmG [Dethiosulfovibrio salsuginis]SMG26500.1 tRNA uridine 5-carboxymethylaminomethyl modification enzyme [Dethiosulfovibrio salsuginis]
MTKENVFDVVVVGAGHGGCEAALASARMGNRTLLLNLYLDNIALMPCNPSIGGPAKGHLIREISALGGEQGRATDRSALMMRWLNTSKGPAVRALRAQCDLHDYHRHYRHVIDNCSNLELHQDTVTGLVVEKGKVKGVTTLYGLSYSCKAVILTTGTYLDGRVHIGDVNFSSGPLGQIPAHGLGDSLRELGFRMGRLKTGTPPRFHSDSIDWKSLEIQEGEIEPQAMDIWDEPKVYRDMTCGIGRTNVDIHDIIQANIDRSPIKSGTITGTGPRYCPSIESKVMQFPEKESHPVFFEPVARGSKEIYIQNFSTSLPYDVQVEMSRKLPGCKDVRIMRPGYAIEYDYVDPTQLTPWLETKSVRGLFLAGQINGTSGYEEAAVQGFMAGVNASLIMRGEEPLVLRRHQGYIGVLVDDLVTKGTKEPYRMLTSRCEHRLLMRHDNADRRLAPIGRSLGLIDDHRWAVLQRVWESLDREVKRVEKIRISPTDAVNSDLYSIGEPPIDRSVSAAELLRRPKVTYDFVSGHIPPGEDLDRSITRRVEIEVKYAGYVARQERSVLKIEGMENLTIPDDFDYRSLKGMLAESLEKLESIRPRTLGQAKRISGVTPTDLQLLSLALSVRRRKCTEERAK